MYLRSIVRRSRAGAEGPAIAAIVLAMPSICLSEPSMSVLEAYSLSKVSFTLARSIRLCGIRMTKRTVANGLMPACRAGCALAAPELSAASDRARAATASAALIEAAMRHRAGCPLQIRLWQPWGVAVPKYTL